MPCGGKSKSSAKKPMKTSKKKSKKQENIMEKIRDFVESELQMFRDKCNFTPEEMEYLNLRAKDYTNTNIAYKMHISEAKVSVLSKRVKTKMKKVL